MTTAMWSSLEAGASASRNIRLPLLHQDLIAGRPFHLLFECCSLFLSVFENFKRNMGVPRIYLRLHSRIPTPSRCRSGKKCNAISCYLQCSIGKKVQFMLELGVNHCELHISTLMLVYGSSLRPSEDRSHKYCKRYVRN